jgi:hypothetical protein
VALSTSLRVCLLFGQILATSKSRRKRDERGHGECPAGFFHGRHGGLPVPPRQTRRSAGSSTADTEVCRFRRRWAKQFAQRNPAYTLANPSRLLAARWTRSCHVSGGFAKHGFAPVSARGPCRGRGIANTYPVYGDSFAKPGRRDMCLRSRPCPGFDPGFLEVPKGRCKRAAYR